MTNFLAEQWIDAIFDAYQVEIGGIVRRKSQFGHQLRVRSTTH